MNHKINIKNISLLTIKRPSLELLAKKLVSVQPMNQKELEEFGKAYNQKSNKEK